ncbi:hypothetical protein [Pandoraea pnomenusa]|uniref:hypothetical protein n=1 Tax=Pandoraea pnomenusa TaxID=93220 RepID=UPI00242F0025|nr:hypothetical protein [Pandoraea pnomenusa]
MSLGNVTMCHCYKCRKPTQVYGSRWCADCAYPSIDQDYTRYQNLLEEGYTRHQARLMVGWADPSEEA